MAQFPSQSSASGLWSLKKQKRAEQGDNWPPLFGPADDYFEYVTMLLPGNGTNGAQNNTFLDSSTNNFTITRNGNTTQGTFTPYGDNWSNYFGGSSDYLAVPSSANLAFGTGDFCVEFWVYLGKTTQQGIFSNAVSSAGGDTQFEIQVFSGKFAFWGWNTNFLNSTTTVQANTYYHVAVVRSGTSMAMFVNGTREATTTSSNNFSSTNAFNIGRQAASASYLQGYISNLRAVKGSSVYSPSSTSITVPTAPLTAITNTSLLTCQSNRFIDNSSNAFAITANGSPSVQRFSPFNPATPYAAGTIGGSGYFDGTGDFLVAPDNAALEPGSSNLTWEMWINTTSSPQYTTLYSRDPGAFIAGSWSLLMNTAGVNSGDVSMWFADYSQGGPLLQSTGVNVRDGAWHHIAVVRNGSAWALYVDGVSCATATWAGTVTDIAGGPYIGADQNYGRNYLGYITDLRILKGTALYTANFTPPTTPLTAITNTSLLLNFTNGGIIDNAMMNDLETVGNAQISTAQSKFGGGSLAFDGTGDYLTTYGTPQFAFGAGDFTIECWVYFNSLTQYDCIIDFRPSGTNGAYPCIFVDTSNTLVYYVGGANRITSSAVSTGQWYHLAVSRTGTSTKMFLNGVQTGSTYTDSNSYLVGNPLTIGGLGYNSPGTYALDGYIDDLRITKGYARYTANFTPPAAPFPTY